MGICCSKAKAKALAGDLDDGEQGFPWMHDDLFHHHLWTSAAVSMHTKQGWKGANQDAMTVSQVNTHDFSLPIHLPEGLASAPLLTNILGLLRLLLASHKLASHTQAATRHGAYPLQLASKSLLLYSPTGTPLHPQLCFTVWQQCTGSISTYCNLKCT